MFLIESEKYSIVELVTGSSCTPEERPDQTDCLNPTASKSEEEDELLKEFADEKEKAEHLMLVDLAETTLGGYVKSAPFKQLNTNVEGIPVMHIVSQVR